MKKTVKQVLATAFSVAALGYAAVTSAHEVPLVTMDPEGNVAGFTGYGQFTCFDDGNGLPDHLEVSIKDHSPAQNNLLVNVQVFTEKVRMAGSTTDAISGDNDSSPPIKIHYGQGPYYVLVNKTGAGLRTFTLTYHCVTIDGIHTGTNDPSVFQFQ